MTAYLAKIRPRLYEIGIHYYPRTQLQGKKINWTDGLAALFHLIRFNWLTSRQKAFSNLPKGYLEAAESDRYSKEPQGNGA